MTSSVRRLSRTIIRPKTTAWCDGSCSNKTREGGWGVYIKPTQGRPIQEMSGGQHDTTISVMELTAMVNAVRNLPQGEPCVVYSDSAYVVNGINDHVHMWLMTGWRTSSNEPVKHLALWQELYNLRKAHGQIDIRWVKGHSGDAGNDRADELASQGRLSLQSIAK